MAPEKPDFNSYNLPKEHTKIEQIQTTATTTTTTTRINRQPQVRPMGYSPVQWPGGPKMTARKSSGARPKKPKRLSGYTDKMKHLTLNLICLFVLCNILQSLIQQVNGAMSLPDGIENILGFKPQSSFQCERDGYFGDIENDCRLFHLCQQTLDSNGKIVSKLSL